MLGALMVEVSTMGRAALPHEVLLGWEGFPLAVGGGLKDPLHATQCYGGNLFGASARHPARSRGCGLDGLDGL